MMILANSLLSMFSLESWYELENKTVPLFFKVCAICGVLCISLPIPIIVNNFNNIYEKSKIEEEIKAKKTKSSWEDANRGKTSFLTSHPPNVCLGLEWSEIPRFLDSKLICLLIKPFSPQPTNL